VNVGGVNGMTDRILAVWLWPMLFFSVFNSRRFIAEHYETPWGQGNLLGTRTVTSNRVHRFFWNHINWHIGRHVYPKVPWHNLERLHERLAPQIAAMGGVVDPGYGRVGWRALVRGPESEMRLSRFLAADRVASSAPQRQGPHMRAAPGYDV
jgi:fatty acid desaturase